MKGITLLGHHSYNDFHLLLTKKEIGAPAVKVKKIDIEGADSALDLTDFFGEPKYEDVMLKFEFRTLVAQSDFLNLFSTIKNAIHGKKGRIVLDDDPSFYYIGRCHVSSFTNEKNVGTVSIECDCEPWKYKMDATVKQFTITDSATVTLPNSKKRTVPEVLIDTATSLNLVYGYNIWDLGSGVYVLPDLELLAGNNTVTVTGTGTITFTYQEASL